LTRICYLEVLAEWERDDVISRYRPTNLPPAFTEEERAEWDRLWVDLRQLTADLRRAVHDHLADVQVGRPD
jgi:hypothetical protein